MREKLGVAAIIAFVVVDLVLVTLAFRHARGAPPAAAPLPSAPAPSDAPTGGDSADPDPTLAAPEPVPDGPLLLALAGDGTVLRAVRGSCPDGAPPEVSVSTDGGTGFEPVTVDEQLTEVLGVEASGRRTLRVAGAAGPDCSTTVYAGAAGRDSWRPAPDDEAAMWHFPVDASARMHAPVGEVDVPCPVVSLTTTGSVRILCESGRIFGTDDDGESWVALGSLTGAVAIGYTGPGIGYALAGRPGCPAAVMSTGDGGVSWERVSCLGDDPPRAIAANGEAVVAQAGGELFRSEDAGETWTPAP